MAKAIFLLACFIIPVIVIAQPGTPVVKGHAWHQPSIQGAKPSQRAGEAGNTPARPPISSGTLYLYLEFRNAQNILPFRLWIDGKPYRVSNELKQEKPVVRQRVDVADITHSDTMVAATNNQVMQVTAEASISKISIPPLEEAKTNGVNGKVVVEYYWKARRYAYTFPEIKMIEAVRLQ